ncbi:hypothetical protein EXW30_29235 (plasmid) [Bacillus mycoides]|nr:hypothetical protein EXW30_29235 [Bacillus mycoides]
MNIFCFSISITSFFRVLVSVCPSLGGYLQAFWNFCTRTKNKPFLHLLLDVNLVFHFFFLLNVLLDIQINLHLY